jgi:hypothetical protein
MLRNSSLVATTSLVSTTSLVATAAKRWSAAQFLFSTIHHLTMVAWAT